MPRRNERLFRIVFAGVMSAVVFVVTTLRVPFAGTYLHFANTMCLLGGLLFGPVVGGLSAGLGSGLYDIVFGYGIDSALITAVCKGAMGLIAGLIAHAGGRKGTSHRMNIVGSVSGALTYVALYMAKSVLYGRFVYGYTWEAVRVDVLLAKLPGSLINAVVAFVAAPILAAAIRPALIKSKILREQ